MSDGDGESGREHDELDSCEEIRRHGGGLLADHGDVLAKLKMQVRDIKVRVRSVFSFCNIHKSV